MPSKFIHMEDGDAEVVINLEYVASARRTENFTTLFFAGDSEPLHLDGEVGERIWRLLKDIAPTILQSDARGEIQ